ncbi:MAG: AAA family ATPase [Marvinbryantia sp.]|uniref:AAA family ATPase n=1 Tax=Marvinbryantia sp. TaxID=2496532 RepID=UPI0025DE2485|nr:AAA family ATPase [uncultured Marvinbryantia sp.]
MDTKRKMLPIGIENFEEIRTEGFYYVDKTGMIKELLENWGKVNLFTRPRRFGKSLNMSMLRYFFDVNSDPALFDGLKISEEKELCERYMGKFPVISVSLKGLNAISYEKALEMAVPVLQGEIRRFQYLLESERLTQRDKEAYDRLLDAEVSEGALCNSLKVLSELLFKHHGEKTVILIDEYDVPLAKAFEQGYYEQMVLFIRNLFEQTLKTNESLQLAVLTGCMRISKESIFTGLNNLRVLTIADVEFEEHFGFTDSEVRELLEYYGLSGNYNAVKEWYDGYRFGSVDVYCPWDVICHCGKLRADSEAQPQNYWSNTSSNDAVRRFIKQADTAAVKQEIERLVAGETIRKEIRQELTYQDMYSTVDNIWSVLFTTGYLTQRGKPDKKTFCLAIPNMEIREIYTEQIMALFKEDMRSNREDTEAFCRALQEGDAAEVEKRFTDFLRRTISIRDTFVKKRLKENFYHGILLGILSCYNAWIVSSNEEAGDGYSDILLMMEDEETGVVIEVKYAENGNLDECCRKALEQIETNRYEETLRDEGSTRILKYGIACYKKRCRVMRAGKRY